MQADEGLAGGDQVSVLDEPLDDGAAVRRCNGGLVLAGAVEQHVIEERGYREIAVELDTSEAVVRKRVSRGLAVARNRVRRRP